MGKVVHIIPLALEKDRFIELFRQFPPHKVYFVKSKRNSEFAIRHPKEVKGLESVEKTLRDLLPLVEIPEPMETNEENFFETFTLLLEIMLKERKMENEVIVSVVGGSRVLTCAAIFAASISKCKAYYVVADEYRPSDEYVLARGTIGDPVEIPIFPIRLPKNSEAQLLLYMLHRGAKVDEKLEFIVNKIGLERLGVKSVQSGVVTLSKSWRKLQEDGFVSSEQKTKRRLKIELTETGKLMAHVIEIIEEVKNS